MYIEIWGCSFFPASHCESAVHSGMCRKGFAMCSLSVMCYYCYTWSLAWFSGGSRVPAEDIKENLVTLIPLNLFEEKSFKFQNTTFSTPIYLISQWHLLTCSFVKGQPRLSFRPNKPFALFVVIEDGHVVISVFYIMQMKPGRSHK